MRRQVVAGGVVALGVAFATWVLYGAVLEVAWSARFRWAVVVEGAVTAGAVLAAWAVVRTRAAALTGLAVTALLMVAELAEVVALTYALGRSPIGWALATAVALRALVPARRVADNSLASPPSM